MMNINAFTGHIVKLNTTDPLHYGAAPKIEREKDDVSGSFADMLNSALTKTNDLQVDAETLMQKMIV